MLGDLSRLHHAQRALFQRHHAVHCDAQHAHARRGALREPIAARVHLINTAVLRAHLANIRAGGCRVGSGQTAQHQQLRVFIHTLLQLLRHLHRQLLADHRRHRLLQSRARITHDQRFQLPTPFTRELHTFFDLLLLLRGRCVQIIHHPRVKGLQRRTRRRLRNALTRTAACPQHLLEVRRHLFEASQLHSGLRLFFHLRGLWRLHRRFFIGSRNQGPKEQSRAGEHCGG